MNGGSESQRKVVDSQSYQNRSNITYSGENHY